MLEIEITSPSFVSAIENIADPRVKVAKPFDTWNPEGKSTIGYELSLEYEDGSIYPLSVQYDAGKNMLVIEYIPPSRLRPNFPDQEALFLELWSREALRVYDPDAHIYFLKNNVGQLSFTLQWYYLRNHTVYELEGWVSDVMNFLPRLASKIDEVEG